MSEENEALDTAERKRRIRDYAFNTTAVAIIIIAFSVSAILLIVRMLGFTFVSGESMEPTFYDGQMLHGARVTESTELGYGDIITFTAAMEGKKRLIIKRIVGIPGDTLVVKKGRLYVNDEIPESEQMRVYIDDPGLLSSPLKLAPDEYFAMGDNTNNSADCRVCGPVTKKDMVLKISMPEEKDATGKTGVDKNGGNTLNPADSKASDDSKISTDSAVTLG